MEPENNNNNDSDQWGLSTEERNTRSPYESEDDEEDECRVCRGPAEEGRRLFKPCMCSGSIGLVHQDCLESWLKVQRRDGSCELCKTKFRFAPQYAENTPDRLPILLIGISLCRRAVSRWLPLTLRSLFAASLWLIIAPLVTAYLYHGWMARPSALLERFKGNLIVIDLISGAVVTACIVVSFLSLMSFADFLRVEWQQRGLVNRPRPGRERNRRNNNHHNNLGEEEVPTGLNNTINSDERDSAAESDVDNGIWELVQNEVLLQSSRFSSPRMRQIFALEHELNDFSDPVSNYTGLCSDDDNIRLLQDVSTGLGDAPDVSSVVASTRQNMCDEAVDGNVEDRVPYNQEGLPIVQVLHQEGIDANGDDRAEINRAANPDLVPERMAPPNFLPPEFDQDEAIDMDINIALDELLGVRGPLLVVARNLLWLLAFNAVFLGFFAFVPRTVGVAMTSILFKTALFSTVDVPGNSTEEIMRHYNITQSFTFGNAWRAIEAESIHQNTALRLHDVATVTLGYFSLAFAVILSRFLWVLSQKVPFLRDSRTRTGNPDIDDMREAIDEMNRLVHGLGNDANNLIDEPPIIALSLALGVALDAMLAIVKVGILLFLKMFLLPIILGLTLDVSTIPILGSTLEARIAYAGKDLFSFILLHWVTGITFMLLVTVSVLQLREVIHPDLLAQMIRPQEPQPDLLGNLMHESVSTHAKRMVLSLIIYTFLLSIHIYLPVSLYLKVFGAHTHFFNVRLYYVLTPQLQVPVELIFFHLCMLALLEKYKNCIGGIQHHWLKWLSEQTGLSDRILPKHVAGFRLVGSRPVFENGISVDPFWFNLSNAENATVDLIESNQSSFIPPEIETSIAGETKPNGVRVLQCGADFIRLPQKLPGRSFRARSILLPSKIGKFRLKRHSSETNKPVIQLWEEIAGLCITRPPEGWDDLGAGGADVQGRWAWGSEKKSTTEVGIAARLRFFESKQTLSEAALIVCKMTLLCILSWLAATLLLCVSVATPLLIGRFLYSILRVPERCIHDPFAFCVGFMLVFPLIRKSVRAYMRSEISFGIRILNWLNRFRWPPHAKLLVLVQLVTLWFVLSPILVGTLYEISFIKASTWFEGREPLIDLDTIFWNWVLGSSLLYIWSDLCILGILTKDFRFFGEVRDPVGGNDEANVEAATRMDIGGGLLLSWQGKHGRISRFWDNLSDVIADWDWSKVDHVNMIRNCATTVTMHLFFCLFVTLTSFQICTLCFPSGLGRAVVARTTITIYFSIQSGRAWKDQLCLWLETVHKTARDDRYLIGETLLNYGD